MCCVALYVCAMIAYRLSHLFKLVCVEGHFYISILPKFLSPIPRKQRQFDAGGLDSAIISGRYRFPYGAVCVERNIVRRYAYS